MDAFLSVETMSTMPTVIINFIKLQENIDTKHQYAGKLVCHALLSSQKVVV